MGEYVVKVVFEATVWADSHAEAQEKLVNPVREAIPDGATVTEIHCKRISNL